MLHFALQNKNEYSSKTMTPIKNNKPKGLSICKKVCYIKACLQCLLNTQPLIYYIQNSLYKLSQICSSGDQSSFPMIFAFKELINQYLNENTQVISESIQFENMISKMQLNPEEISQQSVYLFILSFIDIIAKELQSHKTKNTFINNLFMGEIISKIKCLNCNNVSSINETFTCLTLDIPVLGKKKQKYTKVKLFQYLSKDSYDMDCKTLEIEVNSKTKVSDIKFELICQFFDTKNKRMDIISSNIVTTVVNKNKIVKLFLDDNELIEKHLKNEKEIIFYEIHESAKSGFVFVNEILIKNEKDILNTKDLVVDFPFPVPLFENSTLLKEFMNSYRWSFSGFMKNNANKETNPTKKKEDVLVDNFEFKFYNYHYKNLKKKCPFCEGKYSGNCCPLPTSFINEDSTNLIFLSKQLPPATPKILFSYISKKPQHYQPLQIILNDPFFKGGYYETSSKIYMKECFNKLMTPVQFNGNNKYYCEKCQTKQNAEKTFQFRKLPLILIVYLNKETSEQKVLSSGILNTSLVDYSSNIKLGPNNEEYELYGVIIQQIKLLRIRTYYCYCKDCSGKWWYMKGKKVIEISNIRDIISSHTCFLFYKKILRF